MLTERAATVMNKFVRRLSRYASVSLATSLRNGSVQSVAALRRHVETPIVARRYEARTQIQKRKGRSSAVAESVPIAPASPCVLTIRSDDRADVSC